MSRPGDARDRLQPALLDRLIDDEPGQSSEADDRRVLSRSALRQAVLRDLSWLFNAAQPLSQALVEGHPEVARSTLNYGLPSLAGQVASKVDIRKLEKALRQAILRFEPRLVPEALRVTALEAEDVLGTHNVIEFEIRGLLWGQPVPLEMLLRTQFDLEAGQAQVRDVLGGGTTVRRDAGAR